MDMQTRLSQLQAQLHEHMARRESIRQALKQANVLIERLQGAVALAQEMLTAKENPHESSVVHAAATGSAAQPGSGGGRDDANAGHAGNGADSDRRLD